MCDLEELVARLQELRRERRRHARGGDVECERDVLRLEVQLLRAWIAVHHAETTTWARRAWEATVRAENAERREREAEAIANEAMTVGLGACSQRCGR